MRFLLLLLSFVYRLIIGIRNLLFDWNIFKSKTYNIPIICVGNITSGGTGKTPHIEYLIDLLSDKKIAVLSRGHGRKTNGLFWVKFNSISNNVGDESLQIKQKFPNINVIVSENRRRGIEEILSKFPRTEVVLMDDGFQHRWVKAGLYIVLNNYERPIYSDHILPLGRLRESISSLNRSDIIITTKCPEILPAEKKEISSKLNLFTQQKSFFSSISYQDWRSVFSNKSIETLKNYNITLITSIANAENLKKYLEEKGNIVHPFSFADHYNYTTKDIQYILSKYKSSISDKNIILTTEKDKVKLTKFKEEFKGVKKIIKAKKATSATTIPLIIKILFLDFIIS